MMFDDNTNARSGEPCLYCQYTFVTTSDTPLEKKKQLLHEYILVTGVLSAAGIELPWNACDVSPAKVKEDLEDELRKLERGDAT